MKVTTIKVYPSNIEIHTEKNGVINVSTDGLKGELSWEDWKEDFEEFDGESQDLIKSAMQVADIIE